MPSRGVLAALSVLLVAGAVLTMAALAKDGVRAKLDRPVRLNTAPGKQIRVLWHLVDMRWRPFGAGGIYLRVSRCSGSPLRIPARDRRGARYSVLLTAPKAGIRKLVVGLKGWRIIGKRRERADVFFQFDPPLQRDCA